MIFSRFQWYRRARGGYWAQVTAPMGLLSKVKWVRCKRPQPTPDGNWTFYPWATKTMGNGYIDEWHFVEPCWAMPFSHFLVDTVGTNDAACILGLIHAGRRIMEVVTSEYANGQETMAAVKELRLSLIPFEKAKPA